MANFSLLSEIDRETLVHPPESIASFVRLVSKRNSYHGDDYRSSERHSVSLPIIVQPVDSFLKQTAGPFRAISCDLSAGGVGFVHNTPVDSEMAAIEIESSDDPSNSESLQVLVKICSCREVSDSLFRIGGKFVMRLNEDEG